jgi:hypothetical protein
VTNFISHLKEYVLENDLQKVEITLPPDIYHHSVNTILINSFIRNGFIMTTPEITNWADLGQFNGTFKKREVMKNYRKAEINKLHFQKVNDEIMELEAFEIISENRKRLNRPMYLTFEDIIKTAKIIPIDIFLVKDGNNVNVGSALFYRGHTKIVHGTFWGDTESGRLLRTMDFLVLNLFNYYKNLGFNFIDLGISSVAGIPNYGLIRFKEAHDCISSLRFTFFWNSK